MRLTAAVSASWPRPFAKEPKAVEAEATAPATPITMSRGGRRPSGAASLFPKTPARRVTNDVHANETQPATLKSQFQRLLLATSVYSAPPRRA